MRNKKLAQTWYANWRELFVAHTQHLINDADRGKEQYELLKKLCDEISTEIRFIRIKLNEIDSTLKDMDVRPPTVVITRRKIPVWLRQQVMREADYKCVACKSSDDLTIDHIVPVSVGGSNDKGNLQVMCRPCNSRKGTKL